MGIVVVLIFYAIVLTILATIGATIFGITTHLLTRNVKLHHKRVVLVSVWFPYVCVAFAAAWFVVYASTNDLVFHRDPMLGDTWQTPLPNGYALMMIDTTDQGTVYDPKTQGMNGSVMGGDKARDAVFGVRQLQISAGRIYGARDSGYFSRIGKNSQIVDKYFELNTTDRTRVEFTTADELRRHAESEGVVLQLRKYEQVFGEYRTTWFDYLAGSFLLMVPLASFIVLVCWVWRIRQTGINSVIPGSLPASPPLDSH